MIKQGNLFIGKVKSTKNIKIEHDSTHSKSLHSQPTGPLAPFFTPVSHTITRTIIRPLPSLQPRPPHFLPPVTVATTHIRIPQKARLVGAFPASNRRHLARSNILPLAAIPYPFPAPTLPSTSYPPTALASSKTFRKSQTHRKLLKHGLATFLSNDKLLHLLQSTSFTSTVQASTPASPRTSLCTAASPSF